MGCLSPRQQGQLYSFRFLARGGWVLSVLCGGQNGCVPVILDELFLHCILDMMVRFPAYNVLIRQKYLALNLTLMHVP